MCIRHVLGEGLLGAAHDTTRQGPPLPGSQGQTQGGRPVRISENPQLEKPAEDGDAGVIANCKAPGLRGQGQG